MKRQFVKDDELLRWIKARVAGIDTVEISKLVGASSDYIRAATNRVINEDAKHHDDKIVFKKRDYNQQ